MVQERLIQKEMRAGVRVLVVSDEVVESLWDAGARTLRPDVVLAAGDLPFTYVEFLAGALDVPVVFVPGNHDPDVSGARLSRTGLVLKAGLPVRQPWPAGTVNADGRCVDVAGLRVAGLGGSPRYRPGPNQYTEHQQARRARALSRRVRRRVRRDGRGVDVLLTHAPARGVGDGADPAHAGFAVLHDVIADLQPRLFVHGHVHPHENLASPHRIGATDVVNATGHRILELTPARA